MTPPDTPDANARRKARQQQERQRRVARARGLLQGVLSQLGPGDLAVDCGANIGKITRRLAATGATVHAFEPDPVAFAALQKTTDGMENVTLHPAAVGITDGTVTLMRGNNFDENPLAATRRSTTMSGANRIDPDSGFDVEMINLISRLQDWCDRPEGVSFLKLDIEGAELDILTEMLRHGLFDRIKLTVAEIHPYKFPALRDEFRALRSTLTERYPETRLWLGWI